MVALAYDCSGDVDGDVESKAFTGICAVQRDANEFLMRLMNRLKSESEAVVRTRVWWPGCRVHMCMFGPTLARRLNMCRGKTWTNSFVGQ